MRKVRKVSRKVSGIIGSALQWVTSSNNAASSGGAIACVHNSQSSSTSNGIVMLTGIAQGTTTGTRTGNRVQLLRLTIRGLTYPNISNSLAPIYNMGRVVLAWVKNNNAQGLGTSGGATSWDGLLTDYNAGNLSQYTNTWRPDMVPKKIKIIKDIPINPFNVPIAGTTGLNAVSYGRLIPWKFSINLRKLFKGAYTTYNTTTATTAACESNHLVMFFIQTNALTSDPGSLSSVFSYKLSFLP